MSQPTQLTEIRNQLYECLPTGEVNSFDLIRVIKDHLQRLDDYIDHNKTRESISAEWIEKSLIRSLCEGFQDVKINGKTRKNFHALMNVSQIREWAESLANKIAALREPEQGVKAIDEILSAKELNLWVDFSDKSYDGDKEAPMDRIGLLEYLLSLQSSPRKGEPRADKALKAAIEVIKQWHNADEVWDIYFNHSPEMKPIREYLAAFTELPPQHSNL